MHLRYSGYRSTKDSFGKDKDGNEVFFADIWPSTEEVNAVLGTVVNRELFQKNTKLYSQRTKMECN